MLLSILQTLTEGKQVEGRCTGKLNLIAGFDANTGNYREYKRILKEFGIPYTILADISETFDSPLDGHYRIYPGGTKLDDAADSINGKATLTLGPTPLPRPLPGSRRTTPASMSPCRRRSASPRPMPS